VDRLIELISEGPNPKYTMKSVVLDRYHDILKARQLMRTWADIAEALGIGRERWKDLSMSFRRVDIGVKAGKLLPGKPVASSSARPAHNNGATVETKAKTVTDGYGGFDRPRKKHLFDDDNEGEAK